MPHAPVTVPSSAAPLPLNQDIRRLRSRVRRLTRVSEKRLDHAICDILDLRGRALAVLLDRLPHLPDPIRRRVVCKIEDLLFFHPERGKKVLRRLARSVREADATSLPHLLAAFADVLGQTKTRRPSQADDLGPEARRVLEADVDLLRKGKAVEMLGYSDDCTQVVPILHALGPVLRQVGDYAHYQFVETALFALKRLGGESLLRLLINPDSPQVSVQLRLEWRDKPPEEMQKALVALRAMGSPDNAQLLLKVIELSEFGLPFLAMIREGLEHRDKWVRQLATASLGRVSEGPGLDAIDKMLGDAAPEVRLMAVTSLGAFPNSVSGERLARLAENEGEGLDIRMNALYALFSQKNIVALENLIESPTSTVALNARGLAALLKPRDEGLQILLDKVPTTQPSAMHHLFHFLLELSRPEDLALLLKTHAALTDEPHREEFLAFLGAFLQSKDGAGLEKALAALSPGERLAVKALKTRSISH